MKLPVIGNESPSLACLIGAAAESCVFLVSHIEKLYRRSDKKLD
jgi:hypothetical protein